MPRAAYPERLRPILAAVRSQLGAMPRNESARVARQLMSIETQVYREGGSNEWSTRLAAFASEYSDTEEGLLTQVDLITHEISPRALERLDAFKQEHPGTTAAAKALHSKGFNLGHNAMILGEKRGSDPTDRFFRVLDIVKELESGTYPASRWVTDASELVTGFSAFEPRYAPENVDRVLAAQEEFIRSRLSSLVLDDRDRASGALKYLITGRRTAELLKLKGDPVVGVEALLARLEQAAKDPEPLKFLRIEYYLGQRDVSEETRASLRSKARRALESLEASTTGLGKRKALATLASLHFDERRCNEASPLYQRYVSEFPDTTYAWVAALRVGQCVESDPRGAAELFRKAAVTYRSNPVAQVLGYAYAGRAAETAEDFRRAIDDYKASVAAWDDDYGQRYALYSNRRPGPRGVEPDEAEVIRPQLSERIAQLERTATIAGGSTLERGRWLLARKRWDEAIAAWAPLLTSTSPRALAAEARSLTNRARLERALELLDVRALELIGRPRARVRRSRKAGRLAGNSRPRDRGPCPRTARPGGRRSADRLCIARGRATRTRRRRRAHARGAGGVAEG